MARRQIGTPTHRVFFGTIHAAVFRCFLTVTEGQDFSFERNLSSKQTKKKTARCFVVCQGKPSELNSCSKYQIPNSQLTKFSINKTKILFFSLTELKKPQQCVTCKASLPPATASARCHICHPFLTLLILPPLESVPACRQHPPADEDLERKTRFVYSGSQTVEFGHKPFNKNKLLCFTCRMGSKITLSHQILNF